MYNDKTQRFRKELTGSLCLYGKSDEEKSTLLVSRGSLAGGFGSSRESRQLKRDAEEKVEDGLGAAHRPAITMSEAAGCDGYARKRVSVSRCTE